VDEPARAETRDSQPQNERNRVLATAAALAMTLALGIAAGLTAARAFDDAPGRSAATYALLGVGLLVIAGLFAAAAVFLLRQQANPRAWLALAVIAVLASFVPYPGFIGPAGFLLNAVLTVLAAGCLVANVRGERRLTAQAEADEASLSG